MVLDAAFFDTLFYLRLAMSHKSSMNMTGSRKSVQKGSSAEFSDFREYMPGDDIRRIDWNAYGRLDRLYVKEYLEEKEAVVSVLIDTSASMDYGAKKKSELACRLAAAMAYLGLNNMDRVIVYDARRMQSPFVVRGGKQALPRLANWLEQCSFAEKVDMAEAVGKLPVKGSGVTILISDFLQEAFLNKDRETVEQLLHLLAYRKQKAVLLHVLAGEELSVGFTGTRNLIDMEEGTRLQVTMDAAGIGMYERALQDVISHLERECAAAGAFYGVCNTERDFRQLIFQDLRMLYDI